MFHSQNKKFLISRKKVINSFKVLCCSFVPNSIKQIIYKYNFKKSKIITKLIFNFFIIFLIFWLFWQPEPLVSIWKNKYYSFGSLGWSSGISISGNNNKLLNTIILKIKKIGLSTEPCVWLTKFCEILSKALT